MSINESYINTPTSTHVPQVMRSYTKLVIHQPRFHLIAPMHVLYHNFIWLINWITNKIVSNINMLRFHMVNWIFSKCYCTLTIIFNVYWHKFTLNNIFQNCVSIEFLEMQQIMPYTQLRMLKELLMTAFLICN